MKRLVIGIFKFLAWALVIWVAVFLIGIGVVYWSMAYNEGLIDRQGLPTSAQISITQEHVIVHVPAVAIEGDEVPITIQITNPLDREINLSSLAISSEYLSGIEIESIYPTYEERHDHTDRITITTFVFSSKNIQPFSTLSVDIRARARSVGVYQGKLIVCLASYKSCVNTDIQTIVSAP